MGEAAQVMAHEMSQPFAGRGSALTLEDRVHMCLTRPEAVGCLVCGGTVRRRSGGVVCRDCGSELAWGSEPRGVWVG
jgi:hypothetical protein